MISEDEIVRLFRRGRQMLTLQVRGAVHCLSMEDAEDAVSFAFAQLCRYREHLEPDALWAWLFVVARREAIRQHRYELEFVEHSDGACDDEAKVELRELIEHALALRSGRSTAMVSRLLGLSYKQAMEATGQSYTAVNRHITEGRAELRDLLEAA